MSFYAQAHQHMADLQRELSGSEGSFHAHQNADSGAPHRNGGGLNFLKENSIDDTRQDGCPEKKVLQLNDMGTKQARVIMSYEPMNPNELAVSQNDILIVYRLPGLDADFVMAEKGGKRGRVPLTYLEFI
ncbi:endophilin-B1 [Ditylenchus destructor]|nr:endophilin-B1 [Ditylenchus destructor]